MSEPSKKAEEILARYNPDRFEGITLSLIKDIADAIDEARAKEREACANECIAYAINFSSDINSAEDVACDLAAVIRARGTKCAEQ